MKRVFHNVWDWIRSWSPWHLRRMNRRLVEELARATSPDEPTARAMLLQLRVHQESVRQRTGYMVSAFIADGAVAKLSQLGADKQKQFASVVAEVLVNNALNGIFKRSQSSNKLTALIFAPVTTRGETELVGGIFEVADRPKFVPLAPNVPEFKQLPDRK